MTCGLLFSTPVKNSQQSTPHAQQPVSHCAQCDVRNLPLLRGMPAAKLEVFRDYRLRALWSLVQHCGICKEDSAPIHETTSSALHLMD